MWRASKGICAGSPHLDLLIDIVVGDEVASEGAGAVTLSLIEGLGAGVQQVGVVGNLAGELVLGAGCTPQQAAAAAACQRLVSRLSAGQVALVVAAGGAAGSSCEGERAGPAGQAWRREMRMSRTWWPGCSLCD
jgi:hypothetical protein